MERGIVMLECLSVCRCSLLVVDLMTDSHVERVEFRARLVNEKGA